MRHPLTEPQQIEELARKLEGQAMIAVDTEFIRETSFYPKIEIVQIATREESWLVDAQAFSGARRSGLKPLFDVLQNKSILKILHAAQGDQECLYTSYGIVATPTLDTAVAASLCGYGDSIGLGNLLKAVIDVHLKKGHARTNWSARPLPEQLLDYAHADVEHLVVAAEHLLKELESLGRREWALELSAKWEDKNLYEADPDAMAFRLGRGGRMDKRALASLVGLMRWREARVRQINVPRRWVADDAVLVDLAQVRPKDVDHLGHFRGLSKGELKHSADKILSALHSPPPLAELEAKFPPQGRVDPPNAAESQVLDLMKCYIGILSDQHRIAARHLLTADQMLPILRSVDSGLKVSDLAGKGLMSRGASSLIGEELLALLAGQRALSVSGRKVRIVKVGGA